MGVAVVNFKLGRFLDPLSDGHPDGRMGPSCYAPFRVHVGLVGQASTWATKSMALDSYIRLGFVTFKSTGHVSNSVRR